VAINGLAPHTHHVTASSPVDGPLAEPGAVAATADVMSGVGLTVAAVARRLGVAPATLRTWDRRYGLGPSEHTAGAHRRYSSDDIARLEVMRSLVFQGVSPGDAARVALQADVAATESATASHLSDRVDATAADAVPPASPRRAGGGAVVPINGGSPRARGLARAALALDAPAVRRIVAESLAERGTIWTWDHLLAPVLIGVGERWQSTGQGIDLEHLLSESIVGALRDVADSVPETKASRPVLLASAPEDMHTLPLHAVAAGLAERGIPTRMLGARLPVDALVSAVRRSGPPAVMLWSHDDITGDPAVLTAVPSLRPAPFLAVGGPGWPADLPAGVTRVTDLNDAVMRLSGAVRGLG
jgi:DNA-binding transcriptional MerR regulator